MALAALDRSGTHDPRLKLELLLALGDVHNASGDVPAGREVLLEAAGIAKDLGASRELAQAALGVGGKMAWSRPGFETRLVPLLQDALVHLGGADDRLRVRLLSRLACGWRSSPEKRTDADALSRQAVDLARSLDDAETLSYALAGRFWAIWWPENPDERLRIATEMFELAKGLGGERMLDARLTLFLIYTDLADMANARRELAEMVRAVAELRQPGQLWLGIANRALMMLMEGDFAAAETILDEESDPGSYFTLAHDNVSAARMHRFLLRREQGRLAEIEPRCGGRSTTSRGIRSIGRAGVPAGGHWQRGRGASDPRGAGARRVRRDLPGQRVAPRHEPGGRGGGPPGRARRIRDPPYAAAPFAGRHAIGHTEGSVGSVDRYLGLLAAALGHHDDAARHLEDAVQVNERMGARPWTAHSRATWPLSCVRAMRRATRLEPPTSRQRRSRSPARWACLPSRRASWRTRRSPGARLDAGTGPSVAKASTGRSRLRAMPCE